ncbi:MAG: hypothetical protein GAK28_01181 [Luteibacter sp.]|uniref:reprolysin-like metallopeptidase n=1 Tax=Luteibacter sp. TaxID=1886636 RepID=UPI00137D3B9F|nr:zinc-dependent metalloprotease family protein [Luteibacter sp.]KAF1008202.1 MAG: hypothetical protein GAK28_01181 [Luteibacter sp.]
MPLLALALSTALTAAIDPAGVRDTLADLPVDGSRGVDIDLPIGDGTHSRFHMVDSRTLPAALLRRHPGLRSFRGHDDSGRTARLDHSRNALHLSVRNGVDEWTMHQDDGHAALDTAVERLAVPLAHVDDAKPAPRRRRDAGSGNVRYDFRLAVAATSRYTAMFGGTVEGGLIAVSHAVNRANEVFETDLGVHFTLAAHNDRLLLTDAKRDPFETHEPGPAAARFIDRKLGAGAYDMGHALTDIYGGESEIGTSCNDDMSADFHAGHKAAAWSGHAHPDNEPYAQGFMIYVLGQQLGAWATPNGCTRFTLDDRAVEPGGGSTAMSYAAGRCGGDAQWLQPRTDPYFHAINIAQVRSWLASRGGRCARKRLGKASAPWVDPTSLGEETVIPARTPFLLDARVQPSEPSRHLTYTWEQMDAGPEQKRELKDDGRGPLFRSMPPSTSSERIFPRLDAVLGHESPGPGETLPTTDRWLTFRLTVRDNGGDDATTTHADTRLRVVDTGRPFAVTSPSAGTRATAGLQVALRWDVAGTTEAPISCHFLDVDLSTDGGVTWSRQLATDEPNDGEALIPIPSDVPTTDKARIRIRCDWRPFLAVSPADFSISLL